ncbi:MAG: sodium:proton antiporter [Erysipelotrichales bacterium]
MEIILIFIIFLSSILFSVFLNHFFPKLTLPLIQIIIGFVIGLSDIGHLIKFEPELIMVMIIGPLLYNEAKESDTTNLYKNSKDILFVAFPVVIITVVILGILFDNMLPAIPFAACFALAAALSPTDLVTVSSLAKRMEIPERNLIILEGEGLINDASGITTFQIAVLALVSGQFSVLGSFKTLLVISIGGLAVGIIFQIAKAKLLKTIRKSGIEDTKFFIIFDILTPFVAYVLAEHFGFSGVLAVVTIGFLDATAIKRNTLFDAKLNALSSSTWDVLTTILNAIVFIYLGVQLPVIIEEVNLGSHGAIWYYILVILVATLALFAIRFILFVIFKGFKSGWKNITWKDQMIMTLAGVKGTVTLATITSLPFVLGNNEVFAQRSLIVFISAGIIICSIIAAITILPWILEDKTEDNKEELELRIAQKTVELLKQEITPENREEIEAVIKIYYSRLKKMEISISDLNFREQRKLDKKILKNTLAIERKQLDKLLDEDRIDNKVYLAYTRMLRSFSQRSNRVFSLRLLIGGIIYRRFFPHHHKQRRQIPKGAMKDIKEVFIHNHYLVIEMIESEIDDRNESYLKMKINEEQLLIHMIKNNKLLSINDVNLNPHYTKEMEKAFQFERNIIQEMYECGCIDYDQSLDLKTDVNLMEEYYMNDTNNNLAYYFLNNFSPRENKKEV